MVGIDWVPPQALSLTCHVILKLSLVFLNSKMGTTVLCRNSSDTRSLSQGLELRKWELPLLCAHVLVCVCTNVGLHMSACVCLSVCAHVCALACVCMNVFAHVHEHMSACVCTRVCLSVREHVCVWHPSPPPLLESPSQDPLGQGH